MILPAEPVDGFEIVAWAVNAHRLELDEHRWLFHVQRTCAEVIGVEGVDWINDWECIRFGRCQGRISGWESLPKFVDHESLHFTIDAARAALRELVIERLRELQTALAQLQSSHREVFAELASAQAASHASRRHRMMLLEALDAIPDITISKWACDPGHHWNPVREALRAHRRAQGFDVDAADPEAAFDEHGWLRARKVASE
jgi:hypothetical protein